MIEYNQNSYFDDRLFVVHLCRGKIESGNDGTVETTIFHDEDADNLVWCLATYRNCENYPLVSLNHFETKDDALKYASLIEPTVPHKPERTVTKSTPLLSRLFEVEG